MKTSTLRVKIDTNGHLILPPEIMERFGFVSDAILRIEEQENSISMQRSTSSLARVYVEPTSRCNLDCSTCMRNVWDEPLGDMTTETFNLIIQSVKQITPVPSVFFGGFGEPLAHPGIMDMIDAAKGIGAKVELITNGILLDEKAAQKMIDLRLDRLWVSIDGATPENYEDVRLGDELQHVLDNLYQLKKLRAQHGVDYPHVGVAFVAMKRNIADLPKVIQMGKRLGADKFSISNVLPHTAELQKQVLFSRSMNDGNLQPSQWAPIVSLPRMDISSNLLEAMDEILKIPSNLQIAGQVLNAGVNTCPFVAKGSVSIRWDGAVSPCLSLMHSHESYLDDHIRKSAAYSVGRIQDNTLQEIWNNPGYTALREKLTQFDFSPCTFCNSCYMADENMEDCFGNEQPACGGCLWAQGFIQCP